MYVEAKQIVKWQKAKVPHPILVCALCGRKMDAHDPCMSAIWRAQAGQYIQAYHPVCAEIVKSWGYPNDFLSPRKAEIWAYQIACAKCPMRNKCMMYVFECRKATDEIRLRGAMRNREDKE